MKIFIGLLLVFIIAYAMGVFSFDPDRALVEGAVLIREEEDKILHLDFSAPVRIAGSFPESTGDIVQIKLSAIAIDGFRENLSLLEKFVGVEEGKELHITHMRYEGNVPGGPFIIMKFDKPVQWTLTESDGLLGMNIVIKAI
ncbi:MAG: hypothetical protein V3R49_06350 [Gammaproteobacteria bacterium]